MNNKFWIVLIILLFISITILNAGIVLNGLVLDTKSYQPISSCHIKSTFKDQTSTSITNENGIFNYYFEQKELDIKLEISCIGYTTKIVSLSLNTDTTLIFFLQPDIIKISDVNIVSRKTRLNGLNEHYFTPKDASTNVSVTGEVDIIKQLQVLPGISQGMDGTMGFFVRGGNSGHSRIELDGIPIYGNTHLFGLASVFQSNIVQDITYKMGGVSAQNGNFLSSVTQVKTKNPLLCTQETSINTSPYIIGAHTLFPIKKDKIGILMGGRYSFLSHEYQLIKNSLGGGGDGDLDAQVMDGFLKLNWKIDSSQTISAFAFATIDFFKYKNEFEISQSWDNTVLNLEWNYDINSANELKANIYYNKFQNAQKQKSYDSYNQLVNGLLLSSKVEEVVLNSSFNRKYNHFKLTSGINIQYTQFSPASEKVIVSSDKTESFNNNLQSLLTSVFLSVNQKVKERIIYEAGVRGYYYQSQDYKNISADIRILIDCFITQNYGFEATYDHFSQFYQVLEGLPTGWALNLMIPSSNKYLPARSNQFYSGLFWLVNQFNINIGGYWKSISQLVSYKNTQNIFGVEDPSWEDELESGNGKSYGLEFMVSKTGDKWNWNLGYTLSKTTRKYPTINGGDTYPSKFDRRHIVNIQTELKTLDRINKTQNIFASISLSSGHKTTLAVGEYLGVTPPFWAQREGALEISSKMDHLAYHRQLMSTKNGYSMPNYLRFDLGYSFQRIQKKYQRELTFSVFNVTNHKNPYLYFYDKNEWHQLSIFPIMPSFRFSIIF